MSERGWDLAQGSVGALYKAAEERRRTLVLEERKSDCVDNLNFAATGSNAMRKAWETRGLLMGFHAVSMDFRWV